MFFFLFCSTNIRNWLTIWYVVFTNKTCLCRLCKMIIPADLIRGNRLVHFAWCTVKECRMSENCLVLSGLPYEQTKRRLLDKCRKWAILPPICFPIPIKNGMLSVKVYFHFNNAAKFTKQEKIIKSSWNEMKKSSCLS